MSKFLASCVFILAEFHEIEVFCHPAYHYAPDHPIVQWKPHLHLNHTDTGDLLPSFTFFPRKFGMPKARRRKLDNYCATKRLKLERNIIVWFDFELIDSRNEVLLMTENKLVGKSRRW